LERFCPVDATFLSVPLSGIKPPLKTDMKLSKSLLSAIVVGIAVQSAVSCTKSTVPPMNPGGPSQQAEQQKSPSAGSPTQPAPVPEWLKNGCPACGMG